MEGASGSVRGVWMIDNIGPRILTSGSFTRDNDNTMDNDPGGGHDTDSPSVNYVGGFISPPPGTSHLLKHLENISGGQSFNHN